MNLSIHPLEVGSWSGSSTRSQVWMKITEFGQHKHLRIGSWGDEKGCIGCPVSDHFQGSCVSSSSRNNLWSISRLNSVWFSCPEIHFNRTLIWYEKSLRDEIRILNEVLKNLKSQISTPTRVAWLQWCSVSFLLEYRRTNRNLMLRMVGKFKGDSDFERRPFVNQKL